MTGLTAVGVYARAQCGPLAVSLAARGAPQGSSDRCQPPLMQGGLDDEDVDRAL